MSARVPVTILTGFLGSGKTTLLNRILREEHGRRIGVLVNDFGDVNIDAQLVEGIAGNQPIDLSNGCVCCSMRAGLTESCLTLLDRANAPDYLIVEASGISDPIGVAGAFRTSALEDRVDLDSIICLVDAEHVRDPRLDRQLIEVQMTCSDFVVLNKIDLVTPAERDELRAWVVEIAPRARVLEAEYARVALELIVGVGTGSFDALPPDSQRHDHHAHGDFSSGTYRSVCPLSFKLVRPALRALPPDVFRAKGILYLADAPLQRFVAQVVANRVVIDPGEPWGGERPETALVFISPGTDLDMVEVYRLMDACHTDAIPLLPAARFARLKSTMGRSLAAP